MMIIITSLLSFLGSVSEQEFMTNMEVENHDDFYVFETDGRVTVSDSTGTNIIYDIAYDDLRWGMAYEPFVLQGIMVFRECTLYNTISHIIIPSTCIYVSWSMT